MTSALARLSRLDERLYAAAARRESVLLDRTLPRLTHSADHGLLWFGVAGLMAATGQRRAAVRGLASLFVASAVANLPAKQAAQRPRPLLAPVPLPRRLLNQPTTSSFPSGHSASAAAFAVGVALEAPLLATPVGLLAAGVAYGRVHTGVHYPGDVVAGIALGSLSALAVKRVWPAKPARPAAGTRVDAPALADGEGLVVVVNEGGGSAERAGDLEKLLAQRLPLSEVVRAGEDLEIALKDAAGRARVLGAMGGDGTLNCAAGFALEAGIPLAVFPGGTLNHFAGELGINGVEDVVEAVRAGTAVQVSVGSAQVDGEGLFFLNTFAIGVYPELVRERERHEERFGKWPAMLLATVRVMRRAERVTVTVDGTQRSLWTLFAGNGHYHPAGFAPSWRERMDDGCIDVRMIDASRPLSRARLTLAVLSGLMGRSRVYEERVVGRMHVTVPEGVKIARDGEVGDGPQQLLLRAAATPLVVYCP
jgi:diacylglycerol kinase family enzyme/membrane-associated phospholipid phosphatase